MSQQTSTTKYVCIHGHFYQPPRENAWLETVEQQESARPWHDWNARINHECYAPNAAARILDEQGQINKIRNNYNRISFNFGPTLLSWLEDNDPEAYDLIQKADLRSRERFGGHGSAIAQVHSHIIMPLANQRDKITQVQWGIRDFEYRFGRKPEGMWLAETAVNTETLEVLAAHDIQFTILAPRQAKAVRQLGAHTWKSVNDGQALDTCQPYWCMLPSGRKIALFFYHGGVSQAVAFERLLNNGKAFAQRILSIFDPNETGPQLAHIATDGESYGHHHRFGEMALADALNHIEDNGLAQLCNYGQYLELCPPLWEVQIHENSSWSCAHGVERWRADCGCNTGSTSYHQRWRKPLRDALDWLRDQMIPVFERDGARLLRDPWAARNEYIDVTLHRRNEAAVQRFLSKHARRDLSQIEKVSILRLLEMQRFAVLMYTSCGWFFDEISGIETNQILQYALRAMDYANDAAGLSLQDEFLRRLAEAPSNVLPDGAASFRQNVLPTKVTLERVAMHFAVSSLFEAHPEHLDLFNYTTAVEFFEKITAGTPQYIAGRLRIRSKLTHAEKTYCFAILYLGQQHIIGNLSGSMHRARFDEMWSRTSEAFKKAHIGDVIGALQEYFGPEKFTLSSLFSDEKFKIIQDLTESSLAAAESNFRNVFNDNYQLMIGLQVDGLPVPDTWRNIAAYVLNADLLHFFENAEATPDPRQLKHIADDLKRWQIKLDDPEQINHAIGRRILTEVNRINLDDSPLTRVHWLTAVLDIVHNHLQLTPSIWRSQNVFYLLTKGLRKGLWVFPDAEWQSAFEKLASQLKVKLQ